MAKKRKNKSKHSIYRLNKTGMPAFFQPEPAGEWWRFFIPCLFAAFLLRIIVGLGGEWALRADEVFQYLEQAHRWVFGYGLTPWEYRLGARTWLGPMVPAVALWFCKITGLAHPDYYIPAVKMWHAALSLTIPAGMYLFSRRTVGETAARLALLFGCFWHEFIIYASHVSAEQNATIVFFLACCLLAPAAGAGRLFIVGFLLGLAIAFRFPYLPVIGAFGLTLLVAYPFSRWCIVVGGGLSALIFWGGFDFLTWGRWWHSQRLYLELFLFNNVYDLMGSSFGGSDYTWFFLKFLMQAGYGLFAITLFSVLNWRRHWVLLVVMGTGVLTIQLTDGAQEYTNIFIFSPLLWMLIASVICAPPAVNLFRRRRLMAAKITAIAALSVTIAVFTQGIPHPKKQNNSHSMITETKYGFLKSMSLLYFARALASRPTEEMRAVYWDIAHGGVVDIGGYYYLHHRVPILFPARLEEHRALLQNRSDLSTIASHIVTDRGLNPPGFTPVLTDGKHTLLINDTPERVDIITPFVTDILPHPWRLLEPAAKEIGISFPPPRQSFLFKEDTVWRR